MYQIENACGENKDIIGAALVYFESLSNFWTFSEKIKTFQQLKKEKKISTSFQQNYPLESKIISYILFNSGRKIGYKDLKRLDAF